MSRSYKKTPIYKDSTRKGPTFKSGKQVANRVVRHKGDLPNGGGYKKAFCSYNISDYAFRYPEEEMRRDWETDGTWYNREFKTYKDAYRWWQRYYKGK